MQELYDTFQDYRPLQIRDAFKYLDKRNRKDGELTDRLELILLVLSIQSNWWDLEEEPPCLYYLFLFDYEYSSEGNYLMPEYIDILLALGKDFMAHNKEEYDMFMSEYISITNMQISHIKEKINDIISERDLE